MGSFIDEFEKKYGNKVTKKECNHNLVEELHDDEVTIYNCVYCGGKFFTPTKMISKTEDVENREIALIRGGKENGKKKK